MWGVRGTLLGDRSYSGEAIARLRQLERDLHRVQRPPGYMVPGRDARGVGTPHCDERVLSPQEGS